MVDLLTVQMVSVLKTGGEEDWMLLVVAMTWTFRMKQKSYRQLLTAMSNFFQLVLLGDDDGLPSVVLSLSVPLHAWLPTSEWLLRNI